MKKFLLLFVLLIVVLIATPFLAAKYFLEVEPKDLGVKYTDTDRTQSYLKNGVMAINMAKTDSISQSVRYEGKKEVSFSLTQEEITALINSNTWQYQPVGSVQIKINSDGVGEASGVLFVDRILPFVSLTHSTGEIEGVMGKFGIANKTTFYLKGGVEVKNNKVKFSSQGVEIGRIKVPDSYVSQNLSTIESFVESRINAVPGLFVEELNLNSGKVNFKGTMPEKEYKSIN